MPVSTVSGPTVAMATDMTALRSVMERTLVIRPANPISPGPLGGSDAPTLASLTPLVASISPELESETNCLIATSQFLFLITGVYISDFY
ncbi:Apical junction molecule [Dissostichus eleginoides]|uniref:Apical junction molecule n=1 Tax=Dissostichus eleginoides TaxID=100907 RepID=A0AAD9BAP2_DISEL|nr:Apical junction molecule [Dissostichus eleginoides]